jgi:hypothetical protein
MQLHKLLSAVFLILWLSDTTAPGTVVFNISEVLITEDSLINIEKWYSGYLQGKLKELGQMPVLLWRP